VRPRTESSPPMKVLIAEDNLTSRKLLESTLLEAGYEVVSVSDGVEAWKELYRPDAPQLAILDLVMPRMDGLKVVRGIRERKHSPYVYIILLTAQSRADDVVEGLDAGADDYVLKPFEPVELKARLRVGERLLSLEEDVSRLQREKAALLISATLGHEINNPLAVLFPTLELLAEDVRTLTDSATIRTRLQIIEKTARRIHEVANRLQNLQDVCIKEYLPGVEMLDLHSTPLYD